MHSYGMSYGPLHVIHSACASSQVCIIKGSPVPKCENDLGVLVLTVLQHAIDPASWHVSAIQQGMQVWLRG